jgi:integrase
VGFGGHLDGWLVCGAVAIRSSCSRDLRRTYAKLCHVNGGELEQIQFLLGHVSVLTTERYLGCKQNLEEPVNDRFKCLFAGRFVLSLLA